MMKWLTPKTRPASRSPLRVLSMADSTNEISASVDALMQEFYTITHNLANASTVAYKRRCNDFTKVLEASMAAGQGSSQAAMDPNCAFDFSQGGIVQTARPLDFALCGKGFFVIETPQGPLYTRNGTFSTNQNGQIVDSDGYIVAGSAGAITLPTEADLSQVVVADDGKITAGGTTIGEFKLVDFADNEDQLVPAGSSRFTMPNEDVTPVQPENVIVKQGYQEASNVKIVEELVDMIMVTRLYQADMKLISAQKEASGTIMSAAMG